MSVELEFHDDITTYRWMYGDYNGMVSVDSNLIVSVSWEDLPESETMIDDIEACVVKAVLNR